MVKSGLEDRIVEEKAVPRVSHYRLATHLGTAFLIYLSTLWTGLTLLTRPRSAEVRARVRPRPHRAPRSRPNARATR